MSKSMNNKLIKSKHENSIASLKHYASVKKRLIKHDKNDFRTLNVKIELIYRTCCTNFIVEKAIKALLEDEEFTDGNIKVKKIDISS